MFKLILSPQFSDIQLRLEKIGDSLKINDMSYDFSSLNDGDEIPSDAITDENIVGDIGKKDGVVAITIRMPYSDVDAPESVRFPQPINLIEDGEIVFNEKVVADD